MAETISLRPDPAWRAAFEAEAIKRGVGSSTLARDLISERLRTLYEADVAEAIDCLNARFREKGGEAWGDVEFFHAGDPS